jgi:nitroreductase
MPCASCGAGSTCGSVTVFPPWLHLSNDEVMDNGRMTQPHTLGRSGPDLSIPLGPEADTLRHLLSDRFSCRGFLPHPAERFRAALTAQAEAGPQTPDLPFPVEYRGMYRERRRDAAWSLYRSLGIAHGDRATSAREMRRNFGFFGAPHVAIITTEEALGSYGVVDTGIYLGTLLLAAHSLGVAAVPQGAVAEHSAFIRSYLGIPPGRLVVCALSFGYADPAHLSNNFRTGRAPLADAATFLTE